MGSDHPHHYPASIFAWKGRQRPPSKHADAWFPLRKYFSSIPSCLPTVSTPTSHLSVHISVFKPINVWSSLFFLQSASSSIKHKRMPCALRNNFVPDTAGSKALPGGLHGPLNKQTQNTQQCPPHPPSNIFLSGPQSSDSTCSSVAFFVNPSFPISIDN